MRGCVLVEIVCGALLANVARDGTVLKRLARTERAVSCSDQTMNRDLDSIVSQFRVNDFLESCAAADANGNKPTEVVSKQPDLLVGALPARAFGSTTRVIECCTWGDAAAVHRLVGLARLDEGRSRLLQMPRRDPR
jgi:hypothetical protein